jgi:thiol-disulfide isomerase/thioredoxin
MLHFLLTAALAVPVHQETVRAPDLVEAYQAFRKQHAQFLRDMDAAATREAQRALVREAGGSLIALLVPHAADPQIDAYLETLALTPGVLLRPTFVEVVGKNTDEEVRARALYWLARHLHETGVEEELVVELFEGISKDFDEVPFKNGTLGNAARNQLYIVTRLAPGKPAPETRGVDADGVEFSLADYRGKVVMLRFWGDWCPACRAMYPYERGLVKDYAGRRFALIGVNSDELGTLRKAQERARLNWRSFHDGPSTYGPIAEAYRVGQWPTIVLLDAEGVIRYRSRNGLHEAALDGLIAELVAEAEAPRK